MPRLQRQPHFHDSAAPQRWPHAPGDAFYDALVQAHAGLSDAQSELLHARLVLLLANHIGDLAVLREAIALAREGIDNAKETR